MAIRISIGMRRRVMYTYSRADGGIPSIDGDPIIEIEPAGSLDFLVTQPFTVGTHPETGANQATLEVAFSHNGTESLDSLARVLVDGDLGSGIERVVSEVHFEMGGVEGVEAVTAMVGGEEPIA